jgi:hypothetical protein
LRRGDGRRVFIFGVVLVEDAMKANGPMQEWLADSVQMTVLVVVGVVMAARRLGLPRPVVEGLALRICIVAAGLCMMGLIRTGFAGFWQ